VARAGAGGQFAGTRAAGCSDETARKCADSRGLDISMTVFSYLPVPPPPDYSDLDPPPVCPAGKRRKAERGSVLGRVFLVRSKLNSKPYTLNPKP